MTDIFISYSHKDEAWKDALQQQLRVLERHSQFSVWDDRQIAAGDVWLTEIKSAITQAKVVILLVSSDFLASEFVTQQEIPQFLKRREHEGLRIVPILIRPCAWRTAGWLVNLQGATKDNRPLSQYKWGSYDLEQAFADIAEEVHQYLKKNKQIEFEKLKKSESQPSSFDETNRTTNTLLISEITKKDKIEHTSNIRAFLLITLMLFFLFLLMFLLYKNSYTLPHNLDQDPVSTKDPVSTDNQTVIDNLVDIPSGSFLMGPSASDIEEAKKNKYEVNFSQIQKKYNINSFRLSKYEVTVGEFEEFVKHKPNGPHLTSAEKKTNPCAIWKNGLWVKEPGITWRNPGFTQTKNDPVVCISWLDAKAYIDWLSTENRKHYRLPTEAEWEYAARANTQTSWYWGQDRDTACSYANTPDQTYSNQFQLAAGFNCMDGYATTSPVGQFKPNQYGLYDMLGNVAEWTSTQEPEGGRNYVFRGGSWGHAWSVHSAYRRKFNENMSGYAIGFRLASDLKEKP